MGLARPWSLLQDHSHEYHGSLRITLSLSCPTYLLCQKFHKPPAYCPVRGTLPQTRLAYPDLPPHLPDIIIYNAPIRVATVILINVIVIHLEEVAVCLGQDNPFQACSLLFVDCLLSQVTQPCELGHSGRASRRLSSFQRILSYLLLFSTTCAVPLVLFFALIIFDLFALFLLQAPICPLSCHPSNRGFTEI